MLELGLKGWILLIGGVIIAAVLVHGLWLARQRSRAQLRIDLERGGFSEGDELNLFRAELPNGGARVVQRESPVEHQAEEEQATPTQQSFPDLEDPVPVLLEAVDEPAAKDLQQAPVRAEPAPAKSKTPRANEEPAFSVAGNTARQPPPADSEPQQIVAFSMQARDEFGLPGGEILRLLTQRGLEYGDMNIFHRLIGDEVQYSVANLLEPGTFDLANIEEARLPGLAFFLRVPGPQQPLEAFDHMVGVITDLAEQYDAEMLDSERSVLTRQGIEHARDRIRSETRRQLTRSA